MWKMIDNPVETKSACEAPEARRSPARTIQRLPAWLIWGGVIGLVQIFAIATVGPLGVSTAYPQFLGWILDQLMPGSAANQPYLVTIKTVIGWEVMLVLGLLLGALASHLLTRWWPRAPEVEAVPPVEIKGTARRPWLRGLLAVLGGFLLIFGARLAGGCTSGHMLSGMTQLAVSGLVFAIAAFGTGALLARFLYREPGA
jgi:uncharacterized membrane protein YedE/YeeE